MAGKGADSRANGLNDLYKKKLNPLGSRFHSTPQGQTGPLDPGEEIGKFWQVGVGWWLAHGGNAARTCTGWLKCYGIPRLLQSLG